MTATSQTPSQNLLPIHLVTPGNHQHAIGQALIRGTQINATVKAPAVDTRRPGHRFVVGLGGGKAKTPELSVISAESGAKIGTAYLTPDAGAYEVWLDRMPEGGLKFVLKPAGQDEGTARPSTLPPAADLTTILEDQIKVTVSADDLENEFGIDLDEELPEDDDF